MCLCSHRIQSALQSVPPPPPNTVSLDSVVSSLPPALRHNLQQLQHVSSLELRDIIQRQQQQEPAVKLDLLVNDVNLILAALQELPHKVADPLLRKIMEQANAQLAPNGA